MLVFLVFIGTHTHHMLVRDDFKAGRVSFDVPPKPMRCGDCGVKENSEWVRSLS